MRTPCDEKCIVYGSEWKNICMKIRDVTKKYRKIATPLLLTNISIEYVYLISVCNAQ